MRAACLLAMASVWALVPAGMIASAEREPIPDKLVVLTFDDSIKSHFTVVRQILLKHKFGATFFVTEGFDFKTNKQHYMTWEEIAHLHHDGFEIGNHTRDHMQVRKKNVGQLKEQIEAINARCEEHGIPRTTSFAFPGNDIEPDAIPILKAAGIRFARRGGRPEYRYEEGRGVAYEPGLDHPLLVPSAGDARPNWTLADFKAAAEQARAGRIAILQFHGVPDLAHPWVHSPVERFEEYMNYLKENGYRVIAFRDLERFVDPAIAPGNPLAAIEDRQRRIKAGKPLLETRSPRSDEELRRWLENMVWHHRFTAPEIEAATGLSAAQVAEALKRFAISAETRPKRAADAPLLVAPYPGGRHPRIGFLEGAIRPQRDTKLSVFTPWSETSYVVLDVPEAIRRDDEAKHGLLYLAHTHVDTMWTRQNVELEPLEWRAVAGGGWSSERKLPNGVRFGATAVPHRDHVQMEMWLENGSQETLRNLKVQNCLMLKGAPEFAATTNGNKLQQNPYAACRTANGKLWVITAWENCQRAWANAPCPCLHSDPQFDDSKPGDRQTLRGWLSFYEGGDIAGELKRIEATGWRNRKTP